MKHWKMALFGGALALATACSDRGGKSADDGTDGGDGSADATDATDAADSTDAVDGTDGTDGTDGVDGNPAGDGTDGGPGQEVTIDTLQTGTGSTACDATKIMNVMSDIVVKGAVVTGGKFVAFEPPEGSDSPALDGYFIADPADASKGIQITVPAPLQLILNPGDVVDVHGEYLEFYCNSQIKADNVTKTGTATIPVPIEVQSSVLGTPASAEAYEGVLVTVRDVKVESLDGYNYVLTGGAIGAGNLYKPGYFATPGDELTSVTGLVEFSYGKYKLQPRSTDDIVVGKLAPSTESSIADIQAGEASASCSQESGNAPPTMKKVRVSGTVVSPVADASANLNGVYISTDTPGENSGLFVLYTKDSGSAPKPGDVVTVEGDVVEYFCFTELKATAIQVTGQGEIPTPATVTPGDLGEPWEGSFVTLENLTVESTENLEKYNEVVVTGGLILAGDDFGVSWAVGEGDTIAKVTGAVKYAFSKYRVVPFGDDFIEE